MNANQPFIDQKTQQAVLALDAARARAAREHSLLELALVVSRVHVNHLVKPLPPVRAAAHRLRAETERRAAVLLAALLAGLSRDVPSAETSERLAQTYEACRKVFPREAGLLRQALDGIR